MFREPWFLFPLHAVLLPKLRPRVSLSVPRPPVPQNAFLLCFPFLPVPITPLIP